MQGLPHPGALFPVPGAGTFQQQHPRRPAPAGPPGRAQKRSVRPNVSIPHVLSLPPSKTAPKQETAAAYKECEGPCQGLWRGKPGLIRPWRQNQIFINECKRMETPGER